MEQSGNRLNVDHFYNVVLKLDAVPKMLHANSQHFHVYSRHFHTFSRHCHRNGNCGSLGPVHIKCMSVFYNSKRFASSSKNKCLYSLTALLSHYEVSVRRKP